MKNPTIHFLMLSRGHNFYGHHGKPPGTFEMQSVNEIECVAGKGILGDRFFDYKPDYKGQITFFSLEVLQSLWEELGIPDDQRDLAATRRNVIIEGPDLNQWIGKEFTIQGIRFYGTEECKPCYWMNEAIHPRAEEWMKGRGGLRAKIRTDGILRKDNPAQPQVSG